MKQIIVLAIAVSVNANVFAQNEKKNIFKSFYANQIRAKSSKKELQVFTELNPQFFAANGYGFGFGVEFSRFQVGGIFLKTVLTPTFRDAIFENAKNLEIPKNTASELFVNVFLRKDRKGFYAGTILSIDKYSAIDLPTQKKEDFTKTYLVTRAGFRWFPFKEYFYIDGGYGVSFNMSGSEERILGSSKYNPKSILALPFFAVGARISISKK
jgi:hypothetical protein